MYFLQYINYLILANYFLYICSVTFVFTLTWLLNFAYIYIYIYANEKIQIRKHYDIEIDGQIILKNI
jgi:hypothetical protein